MPEPTFARVTILGVGLLGGSIGLALQTHRSAGRCRVTGYGHRRATLDQAVKLGAIDVATEDAAEAVREADLVVLCTPVGLFEPVLRQIAPALAATSIVTDVGSTKRSVVRLAGEVLPPALRPRFVGSHPMAGSEKRGVEHASADLFRDALCILTPTSQTDSRALDAVGRFWRYDLSMRLRRTTPDAHDRLLAAVSHLPHAVAAALVSMQDPAALELAGPGFRDATRLAAGDAALWRDIFVDNVDHVRAAIDQLRAELNRLESMLSREHQEQLRLWLDEAAQRRRSM